MNKKTYTLERIMNLLKFPFNVQKPSWTSDFYFRAEYMDKNGWIRGTAFKNGQKYLAREYKYRPQDIMSIYGENTNTQQVKPEKNIGRGMHVKKPKTAKNDRLAVQPGKKSCNTYMLMKHGDSNIPKKEICEFYKHSPSVSESEKPKTAKNNRLAVTHGKKSCNTCMLMKHGDSNIPKKEICEFYKHSPSVSESEKSKWPAYGDATAFRLGKRR